MHQLIVLAGISWLMISSSLDMFAYTTTPAISEVYPVVSTSAFLDISRHIRRGVWLLPSSGASVVKIWSYFKSRVGSQGHAAPYRIATGEGRVHGANLRSWEVAKHSGHLGRKTTRNDPSWTRICNRLSVESVQRYVNRTEQNNTWLWDFYPCLSNRYP